MTCPVCGGYTTVSCTRSDCESVYRRRKCLACGHGFYTTEIESKSDDFLRLNKIEMDKSRLRKRPREEGEP